MKRLYRSDTNKIFAGICGGIGEYFNVDPVIVRIIAIILAFATKFFLAVFVYLIAYFVIPEREDKEVIHVKAEKPKDNTEDTAKNEPEETTKNSDTEATA